LIVASDGLFKQMKSQEIVNFVWDRLIHKKMHEVDVNIIATELVHEVVVNKKETDDVTVLLVLLQWSLNSN